MEERWKPNVTVAAIIERKREGVSEFLLVEEDTADGLCLNNPAGHLDPGESPEEGAVREVLEETGCVFTPESVVGIYLSRFNRPAIRRDVTFLRITFCGTASDPAPGWVLDHGIVRALWMSADEIRNSIERHRSPLLLRGIEDYLAGRRYPLELVTTDPTVYAPEIR